ncbi:MAG: hypothetical protein A2698_00635 [Candidatus Levybacteria bacterium RIFCSPHIGHO2_01_FULL_42_15]|nr:MAG: hypothetical protein A2698_00635 [Candidatus Levybacteria bacterium RIFCSPHIGHO2_01_FULL_42_15]
MKRLLIATRNKAKLREISDFLSDLPLKLVSLSDLGIKEDVEETEKTYRENSQKKAIFYAQKSGLPTIADDGGLEIDVLGGKPGVLSRRYFGKDNKAATDEEIIEAVKKLVKKFSQKKLSAKFKTVVTLVLPGGKEAKLPKVFSQTGVVHGILKKPLIKLMRGYPYRSFFYLPKIKKYYHESELSTHEQKMYNHRYKAISRLKPIIIKALHL